MSGLGVDLDSTLFVEAGAGTGKTRALVDRIVALVLGGRSIERIAAITFTEKAAAELRDRVRSGLDEALAGGVQPAGPIQVAIESLGRAQISTIHSFAQTLLRPFAAEARIDPDFSVQDEIMSGRRFEERWRLHLEELGRDPGAVAAVDRALSLGMTTRDLRALAAAITAAPGFAADLERRPLSAAVPFWPDPDSLRRRLEAVLPAQVPADDRLRVKVDQLLALLSSLASAGGDREALLASAGAILEQKFSEGRAGDWGGSAAIRQVRETARDICSTLAGVLQACRTHCLSQLLPFVLRFVLGEQQERGRDGELTFDDLILRLRDLLREDREAVRSLQGRYDVLLIDEFQDTDPLQVDIARAFATDVSTGKMRPGSLFLVGDPKQSIYRFRRADMAVYAGTSSWMEEQGAEMPQLAVNRRSRPVILDWVNAAFARLMGEGVPAVQPPYHPIRAHRDGDLRGPGVAWIGGEEDLSARELREMEAARVAGECCAVLQERWQVADRDGAVREASFRDIALLIPSRGILPALERALADAGVPYRVEGGSLVYRSQEVRDLINCLTAIDDPADEVAVVGALRSPAFACSDVDLLLFRGEGGRFDYLAPALQAKEGPVAEGLRTLARYHRERHRASLAYLIERFAGEHGLAEVGVLDRADRNAFRRVRFVAEQARAFEAAGPQSLRAFVAWLEGRSAQRALDNEGAGLDDDEDSVRVLTIHGAKGLEFPVVFLAGLGSGMRKQSENCLVDRTQDRAAVAIGARSRRFQLGPYDELEQMEKLHEGAELTRLLYVAATRARDHLVVFLHHKRGNADCGAARLVGAGAREHAPERMPSLPSPRQVPPFEGIALDLPEFASRQEFAQARSALVRESRRISFTSATALGPERKEQPEDETEPWARGRGATRLGRAVHAAIQSLPLDAGEELVRHFAHAQAVAEAVPELAAEAARLVRQALQSQAAARARAAARALREVPFALQLDGVVLEGFVDMLIETPDGLEIVDWKTDAVAPEDVPERLREYELQAGLYVYGIESATGQRVSAVTYVFAAAGREVSPGDPARLAAAARARLPARSQGASP